MKNKLHVISLSIPWPPNYGGAIDIYYKLEALNKSGIEIHLHCFQYDRLPATCLTTICKSVSYYKRPKNFWYLFSTLPFIVKTRIHKQLITNLKKDEAPILIEGLHCAGIIGKIDTCRLFVRTHNIEHDYYSGLKKSTNSILKRFFYTLESLKLKAYEKNLKNTDQLFAISKNDQAHFQKLNPDTKYIPAFHPFQNISSCEGIGQFILIHGNLQVEENIKSILFLTQNILKHLTFPIIIAGNKPTQEILNEVEPYKHIKVIPNPSLNRMNELIHNAHIILLHTFQNTGIKLKLLYSLFSGKHCICNNQMIEGTGLEQYCEIANSPNEWINKINHLLATTFDPSTLKKRSHLLEKEFSNYENARKIKSIIFSNKK